MLAQKAGAVGASGMIAPMPTMAMGCRDGLPDRVVSCGFAVISLDPWEDARASAPVKDVSDAVHVGYQPFLCRARGVEPETAGEGPSSSDHPARPVARHPQRGVTGEHPAHGGERGAIEPMVSLLGQLIVQGRR